MTKNVIFLLLSLLFSCKQDKLTVSVDQSFLVKEKEVKLPLDQVASY